MSSISFNKFRKTRIDFLEKNKNKDHAVISSDSKILISSPHGVSQVRLGKNKVCETGSLCLAMELASQTGAILIAKTKNNFDDANFDPVCDYKDTIDGLVMKKGLTHIFDFHGLAPHRACDINLGTNLGRNIESDVALFDKLEKSLTDAGFVVFVDEPFSAGLNTIAGSSKLKHSSLWTIQVEINSAITNRSENFKKCKLLIDVLKNVINSI